MKQKFIPKRQGQCELGAWYNESNFAHIGKIQRSNSP